MQCDVILAVPRASGGAGGREPARGQVRGAASVQRRGATRARAQGRHDEHVERCGNVDAEHHC